MKIVNYKIKKQEIPGFLSDRFPGHFAQISTDNTLKLRSSVKDVARVLLGEVPFEIEELTKQFVNADQGVSDRDHVFGYDPGDGARPGAIDYDPALRKFIKSYPQLWDVVKRVLSLKRSTGRHASAYAISNRPIQEFIPTIEINKVICTQYTAGSVEKSGAIKYDFLRVNSLNDISEALKLAQISSGLIIPDFIEKDGVKIPGNRLLPIKGEFYDIWSLPQDLSVFQDISDGKTETVFQLNTQGARDWLEHFNYRKPDDTLLLSTVHDLAIFTALDRPGPLDAFVEIDGSRHNMLVEYTRRARGMHGAEMPRVFEDLLKETYSILVFQEQVQKLYQEITGCSNTEAEKFRYNVGKKKKTDIERAYAGFMEAAVPKYGQEEAQKCWDAIETFSAYGFCQAHAESYATTAYACAYLKRHFQLEWWCAVLSNANKDEVNEEFWEHCGHLIDLPDIQSSSDNFTIKNGRIIAPISLMHGIGEAAHNELCSDLPYKNIKDFCDKMQARKVAKGTEVEKITQKKNKKTGEVQTIREVKLRLGRSALNTRVIYTMIISGALDSLFPPGLSIIEKITIYEQALAEASGKKVKPVSSNFKEIDDLARFQLRKSILPAYSVPLLPLLDGKFGITNTANGYVCNHGGETYRFYSNTSISAINSKSIISRPYFGVVAGFVLATRSFSFAGGTKKACAVIFDLDGKRYDWVKWPDKFGGVPEHFNSKLEGSIVLFEVKKYSPERPFTILDATILSSKLEIKKEDDE